MGEALGAGVAVFALAGMWLDMRKRTNGSGPLAEKLDRLEDLMYRHIERHDKER